jgi:PAS domain S-box-containing protein
VTALAADDRRAPGTDDMYRTMFEGAEVGMLFTALDGRIHPNPAYCRMLGYSEAELRKLSYEEITHPDDRAESRLMINRIMAGPEHHGRWRKRYLRQDGEVLWADISTVLEDDDQGRRLRLHTVVIDITHRVASETAAAGANEVLELRMAQRTAQLEASNRDLEAFTYSVSHDLRTPLRAMAGFAGLLEKKYGSTLDEKASGYVRRIVQGADRMGEMIDDLLRFSRLGRQELSRQMVDPALLARDALQDLQAEIEGRTLDVVIEEMPLMWADRAVLHHVYLNLLSNAVKFTGRRQDARIVVRASVGPDGACVYSVEDNGAGFDMTYAHKLFGVFQRLHARDEYEGTGVGLALVKSIIERHGGRVWAEARVGGGAKFSFTIGGHP